MTMACRKYVTACVVLTTLLLATARAACPGSCQCAGAIVTCEKASLTHVPWDLPAPGAITQLLLAGNQITEVIAEIVSYSSLRQLDLSSNRLSSIEDAVFTSLPRLAYLNLRRNNIRDVTTGTFRGLTSLVQLDMADNDVVSLGDGVFSDLGRLETLRLSSNHLEKVADDAFLGLTAVRVLDLSDNLLRSVPSAALRHLVNLETLELNHNRLVTVPSYSFRGLAKLTELNLDNNGLIEISEFAFRDGASNSFTPNIEVLSVKINKLGDFPSGAVNSLARLRSLDVSQNPIGKVRAYALQHTRQVETLRMSAMQELAIIEDHAFSELPALREVAIHSNHKLAEIGEAAFMATPSLTRADLHANALVSLGVNTLDWGALTFLDLRYNNWYCDCHMMWMRDAVTYANNSSHFLSQVKCKQPEYLATRLVVALQSAEFAPCTNGHGPHHHHDEKSEAERMREEQFEDRILIAIIAGITGMLLVTMVALMCRYRKRMFHTPRPETDYQFYNAYRNRMQAAPSLGEVDAADCNKDEETVAIATAAQRHDEC